jgi:hypothetical protein
MPTVARTPMPEISAAPKNPGAKIQAGWLESRKRQRFRQLVQFCSHLPSPGTSTCARSASSLPRLRHRDHADEPEMQSAAPISFHPHPAMRMDKSALSSSGSSANQDSRSIALTIRLTGLLAMTSAVDGHGDPREFDGRGVAITWRPWWRGFGARNRRRCRRRGSGRLLGARSGGRRRDRGAMSSRPPRLPHRPPASHQFLALHLRLWVRTGSTRARKHWRVRAGLQMRIPDRIGYG